MSSIVRSPTMLPERLPRSTAMVESTDGVAVALHDLGGSGPDVLICHATGFHGPAYIPFARALGGDLRLWALDYRAHGSSTSPDSGDLSWDGMAEDTIAVLDHLGLTDAPVIGHSLGGAAILLAAMARPELIGRAWLFEPIVFPTGFRHIGGAHPLAVGASRRVAEFPTRSHALARYSTSKILGRVRADSLWSYVQHGFELVDPDSAEPVDTADPNGSAMAEGPVRLKCTPDDEAAVFRADLDVTVDRVAGLDIDAMVVTGGRVPIAFGPHTMAPGLVEQLPNAELSEIEHVAHLGPLEDPDTAASAARAFLVGELDSTPEVARGVDLGDAGPV